MEMGMNQNFRLDLSNELSMVLSPRMLQMLKVLNLPYSELMEKISEESESNPLLEVERKDLMIEYLKFQSNTPLREDKKTANKDDEYDMEDYIKAGTNLEDHLASQIALLEIDEKQKEIVIQLARSLDSNGYMNNYEEIRPNLMLEFDADEKEIDHALSLLQSLEPDGIGARDAAECLLIQVREFDFDNDELQKIMEKAIRNNLNDLAEKDFDKAAKELGITAEGAEHISDFIKNNLNPYPGAQFAKTSAPAIPSFAIKKTKGKYELKNLEKMYGPEIKINGHYAKLLNDPKTDDKTILYLKEKLKNAKELIENVKKRYETMEKIAGMIVEAQTDYFDKKVKFPRPFTQKEISKELGVHPSTVSRAVAEKYLETPLGVLKLRSLCPREFLGTTSADNKDLIKSILMREDKSDPYSDSQIQQLLKQNGVNLNRRTVSDYRGKLGIEGTSKRKRK